jgi:hypothetical protein
MLFNIEVDRGDRIVGYLVPDNYSKSPSIRITNGERTLLTMHCREERSALVVSGRHANGRCGFTVDTKAVPGLAKEQSLEIFDEETGILIYRRLHPSEVIHRRIFRLETHLFPLWRLDETIERKFQYFHKGIERHGRETATQVFLLNNSKSLYLSGRLTFKTFENYIGDNFKCVMLMRDPYAELAERLLTLKHVRKFGDELLGPRDMITYEAAINFAELIEADKKSLRRVFGNISKGAIVNLSNPLTRQLASNSAEEAPPKGAVATALNTLASFAIVGLREHQDLFLSDLGQLVDTGAAGLTLAPEFQGVCKLARDLRCIPEVELLLEQDLEIYDTVKSAFETTRLLDIETSLRV